MATKADEQSFQQALKEYNDAYVSRGDWFSIFDDDATIYTVNSTEPFIGRDAYEKNYFALFKSEPRSVDILKADSSFMGNNAVSMQLQKISQSGIVSVVRESLVWRFTNGRWKIVHMHVAFAAPAYAENENLVSKDIRILKEKLAVVPAQQGVAQ
jgi:ketosteroid isomerase-like protein